MAYENGKWIMHGVSEDDSMCIKTLDGLIDCVNELGFLPLFRNNIAGFSVEERTVAHYWWTESVERDPWEWRKLAARSAKVAYGKFFGGKAGFISLEWFPTFANWRRDGYDFDARWDDQLGNRRSKKIMDLFEGGQELFSHEAKRMAGFGKDGEKNFAGTITSLQMQTYLVMRDFRRRNNKAGQPYGWSLAVYSTPESIWGSDAVTSRYSEEPSESYKKVFGRIRAISPESSDEQIEKFLK